MSPGELAAMVDRNPHASPHAPFPTSRRKKNVSKMEWPSSPSEPNRAEPNQTKPNRTEPNQSKAKLEGRSNIAAKEERVRDGVFAVALPDSPAHPHRRPELQRPWGKAIFVPSPLGAPVSASPTRPRSTDVRPRLDEH